MKPRVYSNLVVVGGYVKTGRYGAALYDFLIDILWQVVMENRLFCRDGSMDRGLAYQFVSAIGTGPVFPMAHGRMV